MNFELEINYDNTADLVDPEDQSGIAEVSKVLSSLIILMKENPDNVSWSLYDDNGKFVGRARIIKE